MAQLSNGWLPICASCLIVARRAQAKFGLTAPERERSLRDRARKDYLEGKLTISGGGANGTGRRAR
jgi:hypothetical protein